MKFNDKTQIKKENRRVNLLLEQQPNYVDAHSKKILYEQGNIKLKRREQRKLNARQIKLREE